MWLIVVFIFLLLGVDVLCLISLCFVCVKYATFRSYSYGDVRIICLMDRPMYDIMGSHPMSGARISHAVVHTVFGILTAVPVSGC